MQRDHKNKANLIDLAKIWLKARYVKPGQVFAGMVHRLDAPVAGVVVVARTSKAAARLSAQFRQSTIRKTYLAVVHGRPAIAAERLEDDLAREGRLSRVVAPGTPGAQSAVLGYRLIEYREPYSLLEIDLETGRRHQIRLQLSAIGLPILGDRAYGSPCALAHGRIALLAHRLCLVHPTRQTQLQFDCPIPQSWPWPVDLTTETRPLWTVEEFEQEGVGLPILTGCE